MCQHECSGMPRRGNRRMEPDSAEDEFSSHFKTSMLFTKSMKSL